MPVNTVSHRLLLRYLLRKGGIPLRHDLFHRAARRVALRLPWPRIRFRALHALHLRAADCEPELAALAYLLPAKRRRAVDVGANYGHYASELARWFNAVEAFELNAALTVDLAATGGPIHIHDVGLSERAGDATLYIPLLDGMRPLVGWASLQAGNCPDTNQHRTLPVRLMRLDDFAWTDVDFIKIDVEGHELQVLRGAEATLATCRPHILIEIKDTNIPAVTTLLTTHGYCERSLEAHLHRSSRENHWFVPAEAATALAT